MVIDGGSSISANTRADRTVRDKATTVGRTRAPEQQVESSMVSISSEGRSRLLERGGPGSSSAQALRSAANPSNAVRNIDDVRPLAYIEDGPLVGISEGSDGVKGIYYSATGRPVTASSEEYFDSMKDAVRAGRIEIFEREFRSGASASYIYDKLQSYMASQPAEYLDMMCWRPDS
jgi:hypothetical protein